MGPPPARFMKPAALLAAVTLPYHPAAALQHVVGGRHAAMQPARLAGRGGFAGGLHQLSHSSRRRAGSVLRALPESGMLDATEEDPLSFGSLGSTEQSPYGIQENPRDVYVAGQAMKTKETLLKVILPSVCAGILAALLYPPACLLLKSVLDTGELSILANDSSQFMQNVLSLNGLLFSILAGNSFYFLYQQTEAIYYALYNEVSECKSLLEQTTLVCAGRPFYRDVLINIQRYIQEDLRRLDYPPAVLLSAKPSNDPLESILYATSVGVPSQIYDTVKSLRQARGQRLGATQRKLPEVHFALLYLLAFTELGAFPLLGAGTSSLFSNSILYVQSLLFGFMAGAITMTLTVIRELWNPTGGAYNVDGVLVTMVRGLEEETQRRIEGGTFAERSLPPGPPSFDTPKQNAALAAADKKKRNRAGASDRQQTVLVSSSKESSGGGGSAMGFTMEPAAGEGGSGSSSRTRWRPVRAVKAAPKKLYGGMVRALPWKRIISASSKEV